MSGISAEIIADSFVPETGCRFTSFMLTVPRFLLAQINTHRMLVRNVASSRAIPTNKIIENVIENPVIPIFTKNKSGMQGEELSDYDAAVANILWSTFMTQNIVNAKILAKIGVHKQTVNRLIEPYMHVNVLLSGTEWENFFELRTGHATQPEFYELATKMQYLYSTNKTSTIHVADNGWHIPFKFSPEEEQTYTASQKLIVAVARAARLSYNSFDGTHSFEKDYELFKKLLIERHLSPFEHVAIAVNPGLKTGNWMIDYTFETLPPGVLKTIGHNSDISDKMLYTRNYRGFYTLRHALEDNVFTIDDFLKETTN